MNEDLMVHYRLQGSYGYSFDYHSHQEYEIYLFHAGSCRYLIHNQIYDLQPGDILLMDGMALHRANVLNHSEYVRSHIHFSPKWLSGVLDEMGSHYLLEVFRKLHHCLIRTNENRESVRLASLIQQMTDLQQNDKYQAIQTQTELKVLLLQVLIIVNHLSEKEYTEIPNNMGAKAEHAENIAAYVQVNFKKKLSIEKISRSLNLSKSYVSHVFKEMTGFTVMEYLMACRLTQVKYTLEMEPDKQLKDIAYDCGFESVAHFSRYFRQKMGVTPKEYRRLRLSEYSN